MRAPRTPRKGAGLSLLAWSVHPACPAPFPRVRWTPRADRIRLTAVREDREATIHRWFLSDAERRNPASDIRSWTTGNQVEPLIDGAVLLRRLSARSLTVRGPVIRSISRTTAATPRSCSTGRILPWVKFSAGSWGAGCWSSGRDLAFAAWPGVRGRTQNLRGRFPTPAAKCCSTRALGVADRTIRRLSWCAFPVVRNATSRFSVGHRPWS